MAACHALMPVTQTTTSPPTHAVPRPAEHTYTPFVIDRRRSRMRGDVGALIQVQSVRRVRRVRRVLRVLRVHLVAPCRPRRALVSTLTRRAP